MNLRALFIATLLFLVCFSVVAMVLAHESTLGHITPRGLAVGLFALFVASTAAVVFLLKSRIGRGFITPLGDVDPGSGKGRRLTIWGGKIAVIVLVLAFLNGLRHLGEKPLAPRLVGLGANLMITLAIIGAVRRASK